MVNVSSLLQLQPQKTPAYLKMRMREDLFTVSGGVASGFGSTGLSGSDSNYTLTSDGNILDANGLTPNVGVLFLQSPIWNANALNANGWTWEMSFKVIGVKASTAFNLRIGDAENSASHPQDIFAFGLNSISNSGVPALHVSEDLTSAFHVFRVAQAANSDEFNVWLDGSLIGDYTLTSGFSGSDNLWIGDGSGSQDGHFQFDYIRWTSQVVLLRRWYLSPHRLS